MDAAGNLYGTTDGGGAFSSCSIVRTRLAKLAGCGTVFKLDTVGNLSVLHSFNGSDGAFPEAGLLIDSAGNLYGTTLGGGTGRCTDFITPGCGTVFKLDTAGN